MAKKTAQTLCVLFALLTAHCLATNLPYVESTPTQTRIRISNHTPVRDAFALIRPARLVIDQKTTRSTRKLLKAWKKKHGKTRGINAIRLGTQPKHETRLVIEAKPDWSAKLNHYHNYVEFTLSKPHVKKITRLQEAASPIILKAINPTPIQKKQLKKKRLTVVIDPGHGGKDPGATGHRGHKEKTIVLKIAKNLAALLNNSPRYHAILTRRTDRYIPLRQRLQIARHNSADLFVSIHADAYRNRQARGSSVFALSQRGATSEAARWIAKKENASELMGGVDLDNKSKLLQSVLINLSQTASVRESLHIGSFVLQSLNKTNRLHHKKVEQAAFVVLKSPDIPSLLIETGFLSNKLEERQLASTKKQKQIARSIFQGIDKYFTTYKPQKTTIIKTALIDGED